MALDGTVTEFAVPTAGAIIGTGIPGAIAPGPDGNLWFTEGTKAKVGRITPAGTITEFAVPGATSTITLRAIVAGPDGALWFTGKSTQTGSIWRVTTAGVVTQFSPCDFPGAITAGPDGALWATGVSKIIRMTTAGTSTCFSTPTSGSGLTAITTGLDGNLWFTEQDAHKIGRITVAGIVTEFATPTAGSAPTDIALSRQGMLLFTENGATNHKPAIGAVVLPQSPLLAATLPASRSVQVGQTATAFATIINTGAAATNCGISPISPVPASFTFQTTNPATNALSGTPNTRVPIAAGGSQTFVVAFTANAPYASTDVLLAFGCSDVTAVTPVVGLNTLLLTFDANPIPDIVALAATANNDGILHITGTTGSGAFAVATVNVGSSSPITVKADTGGATLPLAITLCQTNPQSGQCLAAPSASVTTTINANATPTFAFFGTASAAIPLDPANSRIFVRFTDAGGITRGSTGVAVQTQ